MNLTIWPKWLAKHPDTTVRDLDTGVYPEDAYTPEAQNDSAYFAYRYQSDTVFPVPKRNSGLETKEQVFGLAFGDEARAYPLSLFEENNLINDTLASLDGSGRTLPQVASRDAYWFSSYVFTLIWTSTPRILCPLPPSCRAWTAPFTRYLVVYMIDTNLKLILN